MSDLENHPTSPRFEHLLADLPVAHGDLAAASGWGGWIGAPVPIALPRRMGLGDGLNKRQGALLDRVGGTTAGRFIDVE